MTTPDADAPLIERVKRGDVKAFEMLVVKYQRRIERLMDTGLREDGQDALALTRARSLVPTGGSDWHGTWHGRLGDFTIPAHAVQATPSARLNPR